VPPWKKKEIRMEKAAHDHCVNPCASQLHESIGEGKTVLSLLGEKMKPEIIDTTTGKKICILDS